jgi:hypothetical protein
MSCSWVYDYDIGSPLQTIFANPTHQLNQSQSSDILMAAHAWLKFHYVELLMYGFNTKGQEGF